MRAFSSTSGPLAVRQRADTEPQKRRTRLLTSKSVNLETTGEKLCFAFLRCVNFSCLGASKDAICRLYRLSFRLNLPYGQQRSLDFRTFLLPRPGGHPEGTVIA